MKRNTLTFLAGIGGILFDLGKAIQNAGDALVVWSLKRRTPAPAVWRSDVERAGDGE